MRAILSGDENNVITFPISFLNTNYLVTAAYSVLNNGTPNNNATIVEKRTNGITVYRGPSTTAESYYEFCVTYFK